MLTAGGPAPEQQVQAGGALETARVIVHDGERLILHGNGQVERPSDGSGPSPQWVITGAVTLSAIGRVARVWDLPEILTAPGRIPWKDPDGTQRTCLMDVERGAERMWGGGMSHHVE
jgi:hypothetical protein